MAQEYDGQDEQPALTSSPAAIITLIALALLFLGATIFFGFQTWGLVNWLLPSTNLLMQILAVVNFDVFSYVWLSVGLILARWIQPFSRTLAVIAGLVTFLLSLGCSIIQMSIGDVEQSVNANGNLVLVAKAFIIIALTWNICTLLGIIHIQWPYIIGYHPPKKPKNKKGWFAPRQQPAQLAQQSSTPVQQPATQANDTDYAAFQAWKQQQANPMMAPLDTNKQASQTSGNGNGTH